MSNSALPGFLYVDGDARDARNLAFLLGGECRFRHAATVEAARALVATESIGAVLAEQHLPDGSGLAFLAELQRDGHQALRIILQGIGGLDSIRRAMDQGVVHACLAKPVNGRELSLLLSQVAERDSLRRQNRELLHALGQAGEELEESQRLFRFLFENVPCALVLADRQGRILMANGQAEQFAGAGAQALVGRKAGSLMGVEWEELLEGRSSVPGLSLHRIPPASGGLVMLMFTRP
jgi:PAS domain-containing protein